jgi:probable HAF family extracellular repeat protein
LGSKDSAADGINAHGNIVGYAAAENHDPHAVFWRAAMSRAVDLNTVIGKSAAAEYTLSYAVGINDACEIAAVGYENASGAAQSYVLSLDEGQSCN